MLNDSWKNPWKLTSIGLGLIIATAAVTGLVVANRTGKDSDKKAVEVSGDRATSRVAGSPAAPAAPTTPTAPTTPAAPITPTAPTAPAAPTASPAAPAAPAVPTRTAIDACNQHAATQAGQRNKTVDTVKDAGIGAVAGAVVGAAGGAIAGGGRGAGTGAAIGGLVGAGGGTLYGLNENKQHDEHYRDAYAACMRARGYTG
jgi:hypothetical protein